jgi:tetratricopeptide (TPR) repeat protein
MKRWITTTLIFGTLLTIGAPPSRAVDETIQVHFLRDLFSHDQGEWLPLLKGNPGMLDKSFFQRCDARIRWALDNNQVEDALRFALVADLASKAVNKVGKYRFGMVEYLFKSGNDPLATELLTNVLLTDPNMPEANYLGATIQMRSRNYFDAYNFYKKCCELNYMKDQSLYEMGVIDVTLNKQDKGEQEIRDAAKLNPENKDARDYVAKLDAADLNMIPGPKNGFSGIKIPMNPNVPRAVVLSPEQQRAVSAFSADGDMALRAGELDKAENDYRNVLKVDVRNVHSLDSLGAVLYRKDLLDPAIQTLEQATAYAPKDRDGWHFLGNCLERRFDTRKARPDLDRAISAYQKAVDLAPNEPLSEMELRRASDKKAPSAQR